MSGGGAGLMSCVREGSLEPPYRPPHSEPHNHGTWMHSIGLLSAVTASRTCARARWSHNICSVGFIVTRFPARLESNANLEQSDHTQARTTYMTSAARVARSGSARDLKTTLLAIDAA